MLRIPEPIVDEARRLAAETGLRLFVVGTLAAYAARHAGVGPPDDYDLIVVGDKLDYEEWEHNLTTPDAEDGKYDIPFVPEGAMVQLSRTWFGGLRILVQGGQVVDVWHEPNLERYLNASDKGLGFVVDPVTANVFRKVEAVADQVDVRVDGVVKFRHTYPDRAGSAWHEPPVEERIKRELKLAPGEHKIELFDTGLLLGNKNSVLRSWVYTVPGPAATSAPATPSVIKYEARWWSDLDQNVDVPSLTSAEALPDHDRLALALDALIHAGKSPSSTLAIIITKVDEAGKTAKEEPAYYAGYSTWNKAVAKWHVSDGSGKFFEVYLPAGKSPRAYQGYVEKQVAEKLPAASYVTMTVPGTYESYSFYSKGQSGGVVPQEVWRVRDTLVGGESNKFEMPFSATWPDVFKEATRVRRASGLITIHGQVLVVEKLNDRDQPVGPARTFSVE